VAMIGQTSSEITTEEKHIQDDRGRIGGTPLEH